MDHVVLSIKRHKELVEAEEKLQALEECGVDNWEGYCDAMQMLEEE